MLRRLFTVKIRAYLILNTKDCCHRKFVDCEIEKEFLQIAVKRLTK
jgi:hypothetical protein